VPPETTPIFPEALSILRQGTPLVQPTQAGISLGANWPDPLKPEAYYGLVGEWVSMVEPHTEADTAALLVQFLVAFGNLVGRGPYALGDGARPLHKPIHGHSGANEQSPKGHILGPCARGISKRRCSVV
jgi:hypothetical protein